MDKDIYSVSRLNAEARAVLESRFGSVWVEAEISNLARPGSGHLYFSLKDDSAQVRCAMFRGRNRLLDFTPENGQQVLVHARISLYEPRGDFQLIVDTMEPAGQGALQQAFEALKRKLAAQGLFDTQHKLPLPEIPQTIGVVSSPTGAALRDILHVLRRRFPLAGVCVYPAQVQGDGAAQSLIQAIELAQRHGRCEVLILARGGGSIEDLWAFNNEQLAHAIFDCRLPVVTGIGHEIDFTIADFVADLRAPTPSAAAEAVTPDTDELAARVLTALRRISRAAERTLAQRTESLKTLHRRLRQLHPQHRLMQHQQRIDELEQRLLNATQAGLRLANARLAQLGAVVSGWRPLDYIRQKADALSGFYRRLAQAVQHQHDDRRRTLQALARTLDSVSPLATLKRGYAIVRRREDGRLLTSSAQTRQGDRLVTTLAQGEFECTVTKICK